MAFLLKDYQRQVTERMDEYLDHVAEAKGEFEEVPEKFRIRMGDYNEEVWAALLPEAAKHQDTAYRSKRTGHGQYCPNWCLKVPTGGGKTLLATYAIEQFFRHVKRQPTGLVLWVVPSDMIYTQTLGALKDRAHPYRQKLDEITGGRIKIITKKERFSPRDVTDSLVVLVLMLQSFSRDQNKKENLKVFQDDGRFPEFFLAETAREEQEALLSRFPNLDRFEGESGIFGAGIKTSLGNVIKLLEPFIVLDEGHKAKSELSASAIAECNPAGMCELTATPTDVANVLVSIRGRELEREGMIKLPINLIEKSVEGNWRRLVDHAAEHLNSLQAKAEEYRQAEGVYIRPINLIQVEATGRDQRGEGKIHAEDVKEYLISQGWAQPDQIAIKTSTTNDIENIDLLADVCPIRFIITKQALQEGWDCPFAYSLTILGQSRSQTALTQLVGRVLRQPYARKTGLPELDESYVFCRHGSSRELLDGIKHNLEQEGLGDLYDRVTTNAPTDLGKYKKQTIRPHYAKSLDDFVLPAFVVPDASEGTRLVAFERDILPEIDFQAIDFSGLRAVTPAADEASVERVMGITFSQDTAADKEEFLEITSRVQAIEPPRELRRSYFVQNVLDYVPNPWKAAEVVDAALAVLRERFPDAEIARHQIFLLSALEKILKGDEETLGEIDRLAKAVFDRKLQKDEIRLVLKFGTEVLKPESFHERDQIMNVQLSLFEPVPAKGMNELEKQIAYKINSRADRTYWWYRNWDTRHGFQIVGWQKRRFFPDFILTIRDESGESFVEINLLEPTGGHLVHTQGKRYKRELAERYSQTEVKPPWTGQEEMFAKTPRRVSVVFLNEREWESKLNELLS